MKTTLLQTLRQLRNEYNRIGSLGLRVVTQAMPQTIAEQRSEVQSLMKFELQQSALQSTAVISKRYAAIKLRWMCQTIAAQPIGCGQQMRALGAAVRCCIKNRVRKMRRAVVTNSRGNQRVATRTPAQNAAADPFRQMVIEAQ